MDLLVDKELKKLVDKKEIIKDGEKKYVQSASYDVRVGNEIYFPERGEKKEIKNGNIEYLQPFESAVIKTYERIYLPKNMIGLMQPSSRLSTRGLLYTGGSIDPGYEGFLWVSIRNMAPRNEEIEYGQPIASVNFIKFKGNKEVDEGYAEKYGEILKLSRDRRPQKPERTLYDWIKMSNKLDKVDIAIENINSKIDHVNSILYNVVYAAIAGILAGLAAGSAIILFQYLLS
jgi:deoxycytidine triphosphate deaminase